MTNVMIDVMMLLVFFYILGLCSVLAQLCIPTVLRTKVSIPTHLRCRVFASWSCCLLHVVVLNRARGVFDKVHSQERRVRRQLGSCEWHMVVCQHLAQKFVVDGRLQCKVPRAPVDEILHPSRASRNSFICLLVKENVGCAYISLFQRIFNQFANVHWSRGFAIS